MWRSCFTDLICEQHLDDEYAALCRTLAARLARKRPSPLDRGEPRIWATGIVYTVGSINFLFDKSQPPHLRADKLAEHVEVVQSTMANKSARIRSILGLSWYEPELTRRSMLEQNPLARKPSSSERSRPSPERRSGSWPSTARQTLGAD